MNFLVIMVLLLVVMYVLMIRPQRKRQQEQQSMIAGAGVGDDVLTTGGIYGTVTQAEGDDLVVEIADGLSVHMTRRGIAAVLPPEDEAEDVVDAEVMEAEMSEAADEAPGADEVAVTEGEEAVTSDSGANTTADDRR